MPTEHFRLSRRNVLTWIFTKRVPFRLLHRISVVGQLPSVTTATQPRRHSSPATKNWPAEPRNALWQRSFSSVPPFDSSVSVILSPCSPLDPRRPPARRVKQFFQRDLARVPHRAPEQRAVGRVQCHD